METLDFFQLTCLNPWADCFRIYQVVLVGSLAKPAMVAGVLGSVAASGMLESAAGRQKTFQ